MGKTLTLTLIEPSEGVPNHLEFVIGFWDDPQFEGGPYDDEDNWRKVSYDSKDKTWETTSGYRVPPPRYWAYIPSDI